MSFHQKLKDVRIKRGLTQQQVADFLGITKGTYSGYETGRREPDVFKIKSIAKLFKISGDELLETGFEQIDSINLLSALEQDHIKKYRDLDSHGKDMVDTVLDKEYNRILSYEDEQDNSNEYFIAYYDLPASAGTGAFLHTDTTQKLKVPETPTTLRADFAVRVSGDSMEPKYYDGDILLVEEKPDIEMGQIGIFVLNGTGYVKKKGENGLISLNPKYDPIEPETFDDCRCIGKVIGKL